MEMKNLAINFGQEETRVPQPQDSSHQLSDNPKLPVKTTRA
jgi:hypothetical protein